MAKSKSPALVAVVMGSASDWETMRQSVQLLDELAVPNEHKILSAHRSPEATADFARSAADSGLRVIIAGAGGAALLAVSILAVSHDGARKKLEAFRKKQTDAVIAQRVPK